MTCKRCGAEIPVESKFCSECGKKVRQSIITTNNFNAPNEESVKNNFIKPKRKVVITTIIIVSIVCLSIIVQFIGKPYFTYESAMNSYNNREYDTAIVAFKSLKNYKDSKSMINECIYEKAIKFVADSDYSKAIDLFNSLKNFKDSSAQLNHSKYLLAEQEIGNSDYASAIKLLTNLGNYEDSKNMLSETKYFLGKEYYDAKSYTNAISILTELGNYKDSKILISNAQIEVYHDAVNSYTLGDFNKAQTLFKSISGYKDSSKYLNNTSLLLQFQGTWTTSVDEQLTFNGWSVSDTLMGSCNYNIDGKLLKSTSTSSCFTEFELDDDSTLTATSNDASMFFVKEIDTPNNQNIQKSDPAIGMTEQQVLDSSWGKPENINKTITTNDVEEQWCYSNNKYIYFDNGIVTTIQE